MQNNHLATRFKELRQERGLSLREAAGNITTAATLSRFEQGTTQLSAQKFIELLDTLHFDWALFAKPNSNQIEPLTIRINLATDQRDIAKLRELGQPTVPFTNKVLMLTCTLYRATFGDEVDDLSEQLDEATDLIFKTEDWTPIIFQLVGGAVSLVKPSVLAQINRMSEAQIDQNVGKMESDQRLLGYNVLYRTAIGNLKQSNYATCQTVLNRAFELEKYLYSMPWHLRFVCIQELCRQEQGLPNDPTIIRDTFAVLTAAQDNHFVNGLQADLAQWLS